MNIFLRGGKPERRLTGKAVRGIFIRVPLAAVLVCRLSGMPPFAEAADFGDAYVTSSIGDASILNPVLSADSASNDIINLVYNGLVKYDKDIQLVGDLAQSWETSRNGLIITFHLRKNVRWHDGKPFTAEDVLFTYEKLRDPKVHTPHSSDYDVIQSVTAPDPWTIKVVYEKPFAPGLASWGIGVVPKHIFKNGDFNSHPANRRPIGTGPYRFKEWKTAQHILLEANPDYFEGKVFLSRFVYRIIPDQSVQFLEMRNQSLDSLALSPDQYKAYDEIFENHQRYRYPAFAYSYMGLNLKNPLFKDRRVREAVACSIDRNTLVKGLLLGLGQPVTGPYPISSWAYNKKVPITPFDPARAKKLLFEAGWKPGPGGMLYKDGKPFAFTIITNQGNKLRELAAQVIQQQLRQVGMDVKIQIIEWSTFLRQFINKRDYEAMILGWSLGLDPDNYAMWHSSQQKEEQYNLVGYSNPEVDRLLDQGRQTFGEKKRQAIYWRIHELIAADYPYIFLYCPDNLVAIHKRIEGPEVAAAGLGWNFWQWWVSKSKQKYAVMTP